MKLYDTVENWPRRVEMYLPYRLSEGWTLKLFEHNKLLQTRTVPIYQGSRHEPYITDCERAYDKAEELLETREEE